MNKTLFIKECKSNYKMILIFMAVLTMYTSMIIAMFDPKLGESLKVMEKSMPELFNAFGMGNAISTLIDFVGNYLYGFIVIVFPMIFIILMVNRLISRYVDKGSLAYLLATPNTRNTISSTQAIFLLFSLFLLVAYVTVLGIVLSELMFPSDLDITSFLLMNVGLLGLLVFLSGVCFLSVCLFKEIRLGNGVGSAILIASVLLQMVSQVGEKFEILKYATPLTLFDVNGIVAQDVEAFLKMGALYILGLVMYLIGIKVFHRKDFSI